MSPALARRVARSMARIAGGDPFFDLPGCGHLPPYRKHIGPTRNAAHPLDRIVVLESDPDADRRGREALWSFGKRTTGDVFDFLYHTPQDWKLAFIGARHDCDETEPSAIPAA